MKEHKKAYIKYRLDRAYKCLNTAKRNFPDDLSTVVNRLYYACFYCVIAILSIKNIYAKSHKATAILFGKHFVKTKLVPIRLAKFYNEILEHRFEADYVDFTEFEPHQAKKWITKTEEFIEYIRTLINELITEEKDGRDQL